MRVRERERERTREREREQSRERERESRERELERRMWALCALFHLHALTGRQGEAPTHTPPPTLARPRAHPLRRRARFAP